MDINKINTIKQNILHRLCENIKEHIPFCYETDKQSLIITYGGQKAPTHFDLEIVFSSPNDFDFFNILNPITHKPLIKIDKEKARDLSDKVSAIETDYLLKIKHAVSKEEKAILQRKMNEEKQALPKVILEKKLVHLNEDEVIQTCVSYLSCYQNIATFKKVK